MEDKELSRTRREEGVGSWVFWGLCVVKGRILVFFGGGSEPY
jgi:hypothetical protein